jgi:hypothetical protein
VRENRRRFDDAVVFLQLLMVLLQARIYVGGDGGHGHCDLKLKVDAIELVHVAVSNLVAEVHLVEGGDEGELASGKEVAVVLLGGVGRWNEKRTHHAHTHAARGDGVVAESSRMDGE